MKLYPIETGNFKLDGGAMFGVVPKTIWNKTNPADENNLIELAARCLLIEDGNRLILIDTGMGNKQSDKFFGYYSLWGTHAMDKSLAKFGFHRDDITDVFMTHLHFDHCGGSVQWNEDKTGYEVAFKNAKFWTTKIIGNGQLYPMPEKKIVSTRKHSANARKRTTSLYQKYETDFVQKSELDFGIFLLTVIPKNDDSSHSVSRQNHLFMADLLPTVGHIPLPYVMGYDTRPLLTRPEKSKFLNAAAENNYYLFLEHDAHNEIITVEKTEKGVRLKEIFQSDEILK